MSSRLIEIDDFGRSISRLLEEVEGNVDKGSRTAVRKAAKKGRDEVEEKAPRRNHEEQHYADGWTYKVKKSTEGHSAEIGNVTKPGLAHLLEKGHAKVGGGRVDPSPKGGHIAPAAETAFGEFVRLMNEEVKM